MNRRRFMGGGIDSDALEYINAVGLTNVNQINAINNLVEDLKSSGLWDKLEGVYPIMGDTLEKAGYNLKKYYTNNLLLEKPSEISNLGYGIIFNYDTPKIAYPTVSAISHHISIYVRDALTDQFTHINAGDISDSKYSITIPMSSNVYFYFGYTSSQGIMNNSIGRGYFVFDKLDNYIRVYQDANRIINQFDSQSQPFKTGYIYFNQVSEGFYTNPIPYGFITIGQGLGKTLCDKLYDAVTKFLKSIGRLYV